jgi:hypothetical protein
MYEVIFMAGIAGAAALLLWLRDLVSMRGLSAEERAQVIERNGRRVSRIEKWILFAMALLNLTWFAFRARLQLAQGGSFSWAVGSAVIAITFLVGWFRSER